MSNKGNHVLIMDEWILRLHISIFIKVISYSNLNSVPVIQTMK